MSPGKEEPANELDIASDGKGPVDAQDRDGNEQDADDEPN